MDEVLKKCVKLLWNLMTTHPVSPLIYSPIVIAAGSLETKFFKTSASTTLGYTLPMEGNAVILKTIRSSMTLIFIAEAVMTGTHH